MQIESMNGNWEGGKRRFFGRVLWCDACVDMDVGGVYVARSSQPPHIYSTSTLSLCLIYVW